ncbi:MAG: hypothetical protein HY054_10135 [Proteobacteria bacterium]|nr:hypothetical protein [Pseudomonadota bacterium]
MRALKFAAVVGIGMGMTGAAFAGPWNDPAGRVNFTAPSGWVTQVQRDNPQTIVLTGNANNECYVLTSSNAGTSAAQANRIHALIEPMSAADWQTVANSVTPMFPHHNATVTSQSVDSTGFWPLQRAQLGGAERPVMAALSHRPGGLDLIALCWSYGGPDATATYETFFHSLGNSQDATWQATVGQEDAAHAAAVEAAQQAAAQQQQQNAQAAEAARGRNGHARGDGPALNPGPH